MIILLVCVLLFMYRRMLARRRASENKEADDAETFVNPAFDKEGDVVYNPLHGTSTAKNESFGFGTTAGNIEDDETSAERAARLAEEARLEDERQRELRRVKLTSAQVKQIRDHQDTNESKAREAQLAAQEGLMYTDDPKVVARHALQAAHTTEAAVLSSTAEAKARDEAVEARRKEREAREAERELERQRRSEAEIQAR